MIEGNLEANQKVLIIEDLVSTGGSSLGAVEAVREARGDVQNCIAIFTYDLPQAKKRFEEAKCKLFTLTNFSELVHVASEHNYISVEEVKIILEWKKDPEGWAGKVGV